jgi:hypothetical protein
MSTITVPEPSGVVYRSDDLQARHSSQNEKQALSEIRSLEGDRGASLIQSMSKCTPNVRVNSIHSAPKKQIVRIACYVFYA